jgi:hypothetical protein
MQYRNPCRQNRVGLLRLRFEDQQMQRRNHR